MCKSGRSLGDDWSALGRGQRVPGSQAAARSHHGALRLGMLQGLGLGMVQRCLPLWVLRLGWVLELKLGFELLLIHTRRSIMGKRLWGGEAGATNSWDHFKQPIYPQSLCLTLMYMYTCIQWFRCVCVCLHMLVCLMSRCLIYIGERSRKDTQSISNISNKT